MTSVLSLRHRILIASAVGLTVLGAAPAMSAEAPKTGGTLKGETIHRDHGASSAIAMHCNRVQSGSMNGVASDPEEGGQVSARKVTVGDMQVSKRADQASSKMMDHSSPGSSC